MRDETNDNVQQNKSRRETREPTVFQQIQAVLARYSGTLPVYLELPRAGSGMRRVATSFRARAAGDLGQKIDEAVGAGVVDVVLPESLIS